MRNKEGELKQAGICDPVSRAPGSDICWIIAGGGTGGHLFPGIAIARELERRFKNSEVLFVVGHRKMELEILSRYGYKVRHIDIEGVKGRGWKKGLAVLLKLPKSFRQSMYILKEFSPALIIGMGGYSAGPICLAAKLMRIPTAIHEQNSYPGLTNRLLSRFVDHVFISFEESRNYLKARSVSLTGNPVRRELFFDNTVEVPDSEVFTILVVGGSQGARAINEAFAEALVYLRELGRSPRVIHQTGDKDYKRVMEDYRHRGVEGEIAPFILDMRRAYRRASLVVTRAGATTIFELAALGKASILIPYPYATNHHQEINAKSLVRAGGAEMIQQSDLSGEALAQILMKYMDDPSALEEMGKKARKMGRLDAAREIADELEGMCKWIHC